MSLKKVVIYCDGACSGNPGPGGWGSIVISKNQVIELGAAALATTNNRMELSAVLESLQYCMASFASDEIDKFEIYTDSVYVIRGITQWIFGWKKRGWKNSENQDVFNQDIWIDLDKAVLAVKKKFDCELNWSYVRGHTGVAGNERCDVIAVAFSKQDYISLYKGKPEHYFFDVNEIPKVEPLPEVKSKSLSSAPKKVWYLSYVNGVLAKHNTWGECEAVVKGRPAKFKKVSSAEEENEVKKSWGVS